MPRDKCLTKKQRRNPQDATIRNVRAANKKIAALDKRVTALEQKDASHVVLAHPASGT